MLRHPSRNALSHLYPNVIDQIGVRVLRRTQHQVLAFQYVDKAGVARNHACDKVDDPVQHQMQRIRGRHAAADLMQKVHLRQAIAKPGHGRGRSGHAAYSRNPAPLLFPCAGRLRCYSLHLALALLLQQSTGVLRRFVHQEAHLRPGRLKVRLNSVVFQLFGCCRADGKHHGLP